MWIPVREFPRFAVRIAVLDLVLLQIRKILLPGSPREHPGVSRQAEIPPPPCRNCLPVEAIPAVALEARGLV